MPLAMFETTRQSKHCGFSIYMFDNSKSKSIVRLVRAEKMVLSGLVFARKIARMILIQNIQGLMGPLMINMAFMPLYMWEMWDVTPVTDEHTDSRKVVQYSVWTESAKRCRKQSLTRHKKAGLHKLWYPGIRDRSTWSKFGAHGEHGDVFLFSNLGVLWFSENLIRYSLHICLREVKNNLFSFKHSYLRHFSWRF